MSIRKIIVFSAPSGAGKTTIIKNIIERVENLSFSVSATSRYKRENEVDGIDYYFFSSEEFMHKIALGQFAEYEEVYPGHFYGTLQSEIDKIWNMGLNIIFDVDVKGALKLKSKFPNNSLLIFISPPSLNDLKKRLLSRATDSEENIEKRIRKAEVEILFANQFDYNLVNNDLETALDEIEIAIQRFLKK